MKLPNLLKKYKIYKAKKRAIKENAIREAKEKELIQRRISLIKSYEDIKTELTAENIDRIVEDARQSVLVGLSKSSSLVFKHFCN